MVVYPSPVVRLAAEGDLSDNADTSQQPSTYILTSPYRTRTSKFRSEIEHTMPILIRESASFVKTSIQLPAQFLALKTGLKSSSNRYK